MWKRLLVYRILCLFGVTLWGSFGAASDHIFSSPTLADVPVLIECFDDPNLRLGASKAIESIGSTAVPQLIAALDDEQQGVRIWSAYTLGKVGPPASAAAPSLAGLLSSDDVTLRRVVARALGNIRADDSKMVDSLANAAADKDMRVRQHAIVSLGQIGPTAGAAVAQLVDALDDQQVRAHALASLVQIGTAAIPVLTEALNDDSIRLDAADALRRLDLETAKRLGVDKTTRADLAALEISLHHQEKDLEARESAASQLAELGTEAVPILVAAFADDQREINVAASAAFSQIGPSAVPLLQEALQHESARVRLAAVDALSAMGRSAKNATPQLIAALADADRDVRYHAVKSFGVIGAAPDPAIDALIFVLHNPREQEATRQLAVKTLALVAPAHEKTIAAFRESTKDRNYGVSSLAREMLKRLDVNE